MKTLTKDLIQKLTPEQQEMLAAIEVQHIRKRDQLLEQARRYSGQRWLPSIIFSILIFLPVFTLERSLPFCVIGLAAVLWILIQFHAAGINRRLDALVELKEVERNKADDDAV